MPRILQRRFPTKTTITGRDAVVDTVAVAPGASAGVGVVTAGTAGTAVLVALVHKDGTAVVVTVSTAARLRSPSVPLAPSVRVPTGEAKALAPTVVLTMDRHPSPFSISLEASTVITPTLRLLRMPMVAAMAVTATPAVPTPRLPLPPAVTSPSAKVPLTFAA